MRVSPSTCVNDVLLELRISSDSPYWYQCQPHHSPLSVPLSMLAGHRMYPIEQQGDLFLFLDEFVASADLHPARKNPQYATNLNSTLNSFIDPKTLHRIYHFQFEHIVSNDNQSILRKKPHQHHIPTLIGGRVDWKLAPSAHIIRDLYTSSEFKLSDQRWRRRWIAKDCVVLHVVV